MLTGGSALGTLESRDSWLAWLDLDLWRLWGCLGLIRVEIHNNRSRVCIHVVFEGIKDVLVDRPLVAGGAHVVV